ncbi:MAG: TlpA disulfide reductase family protein [Gemmatimonadetes bacterium]|nr:TlpA disulfide reductase family protein [Gemmatimonadota bacterium]
MANPYGSLLIAILLVSSACLAVKSTQSQPSIATITGEIRDPTSREITFSYESPSALESSEQRIVLDSLDRFAFELPVVRGIPVWGHYERRRSIFFVEPGDSLHIVVEEGVYSFSGPNADNSRFIAELGPRFRSSRLGGYKDLEVEDFKRQMEQRRRERFEFLAEGREQYTLSLGYIDHATANFNYGWAELMMAYPTNYRIVNGRENRDITPEYYDFLQGIPLVNEKAIGTDSYSWFLGLFLDWEDRNLSEAIQTQVDSIYTTPVGRTWNLAKRYDLAKQKLEGRVLYWFLAGELIDGFKRGGSEAFALTYRKWEDFQQINPHPEYNEPVQAALDEALKLQPGQSAPAFTLDDLDGQPVSLGQFKGQVVLLDFWSSWCKPCISDLPNLRKIKEKTAGWPVVFLNISLDVDEAAWREAVDKHEIEGVHVRAAGWFTEVTKSYQVSVLPVYYLVDSQGLILDRLSGVKDTDEIVAMIEQGL